MLIVISKKLAGTVAAVGTVTEVEPVTEPETALTVVVPNPMATPTPELFSATTLAFEELHVTAPDRFC